MRELKFLAAGLLACATTSALAHARLESSEPKAASVVEHAPSRIVLRFNEALEPAFSKIALADARGSSIALPGAEFDKDNHKTLAAKLPILHAGQYRVQWTAMGHDGHKTKGEFAFTVK